LGGLRTASSVNGCFFGFAVPLPPTVGVFVAGAVDESSVLVVEDEDVLESQPMAKTAMSAIASNSEDLRMDGVPASNKHGQLHDVAKPATPTSSQEADKSIVATWRTIGLVLVRADDLATGSGG
jgi:hypothetical protein